MAQLDYSILQIVCKKIYLDGSAADLLAMARVSPMAYQAAAPWIFRHVYFHLSEARTKPWFHAVLLLKFAQPLLRPFVYGIKVKFDIAVESSGLSDYRDGLLTLIPMLPNLTEVSLEDVTAFPRELLRVVNGQCFVEYLTVRTCFGYLRNAEDIELLSSNSKLVSLSFNKYSCFSKDQENQRDVILSNLLLSLPNLKHLEIFFTIGEEKDLDQTWYRAPISIVSGHKSAALESLTIHMCEVEHRDLLKILTNSGYAGFKRVRLITCAGILAPSSFWKFLSCHTTALEIIDPIQVYSTMDHFSPSRAVAKAFWELGKVEVLNLQNLGVPFYAILLGMGGHGVYLRHLRLHDNALSGLDQAYDIHQHDYLTVRVVVRRRVEILWLLRTICPNLTKLSVDLSSTGLDTDEHRVMRGLIEDVHHCLLLRSVGPLVSGASIRGTFRSFDFLRHLIIAVRLKRQDWTRDYALELASSLWSSSLQMFEMLGPRQNISSAYNAFRKAICVPTTEQPWWVITRKNRHQSINVQPEDLIAVNQNEPDTSLDWLADWHAWVDWDGESMDLTE